MIATCNNCEQFKVPWDDAGKAIMAEHVTECWIENPPVVRSALAATTGGCRSHVPEEATK